MDSAQAVTRFAAILRRPWLTMPPRTNQEKTKMHTSSEHHLRP